MENREEIHQKHRGNNHESQEHWQFIIISLQMNFFPILYMLNLFPTCLQTFEGI